MPNFDEQIAAFIEAQKQAEQNKKDALLRQGFDQIGAGLAQAPAPNLDMYKTQVAQADQPVTDLADQIKFKSTLEKGAQEEGLGSPDSGRSKAFQGIIQKLYGDQVPPEVLNSLSASDANLIFKPLEMQERTKQLQAQMAGQREDRALSRDQQKMMQDERLAAQKEALSLKQQEVKSHSTDKQIDALKNDLDPNKARGGNLAFNQKKIDQAERLEGLFTESNGSLRNLDSRQMEELAIGLNSMLSNSNTGAVSQVQALLPRTAIGNASKLFEWLSNDPTGTNQIEFVKRMAETVQREKSIASKQVQGAQKKRLSAYTKLKEQDPERYQEVIHAYGLDAPEQTSPTGKVKIKLPDGRVGEIPEENLEDAIKHGAKRL